MTDETKQPRTVADELSDLEEELGIPKQRIDELRRIISVRNKSHTTLSDVILDISKIDMISIERDVVLFEYGIAWMTNVVRNQHEHQKIH